MAWISSFLTGETMRLQITQVRPLRQGRLYQLYPHAYLTEIRALGFSESGCGEAQHPIVAIQKSISEAVERCLFRALKGSRYGTPTSNGWAAHFSAERARSSALYELLERDAVLVHSLREIPFVEIQPETLPAWINAWAKRELEPTAFPRLRVLVSTHGHFPSVSAAFVSPEGHGVISHSNGDTIEQALMRALAETCRLGRMALSGNYRAKSADLFSPGVGIAGLGPCEQAVAYAHHQPFPSWIFGDSVPWKQVTQQWGEQICQFNANPISYEYVSVLESPIYAGYCKSKDVQNLFFGKTLDAEKRGDLNIKRLEQVRANGRLSVLPHFVA